MKTPEELADHPDIRAIVNRLFLHMLKDGTEEFSVQPTAGKLKVLSDFDELVSFPENRLKGVVIRLKIMANLPIDVFDTSEEGEIELTIAEEPHTFVVRLTQNAFGHGIVVRRKIDAET